MVWHTSEDFTSIKNIAAASVLSLQSAGIERSEFYTPETNCFAVDSDALFRKKSLDIMVT